MNFTEINTWATNVVLLLQIVGGALTVICVAVAAIMIIISRGNPQKYEQALYMIGAAALGLFILLGAPKIAQILQGLATFLKG